MAIMASVATMAVMTTVVAMVVVAIMTAVVAVVIVFAVNHMAFMTMCAVGLGVVSHMRGVMGVLSGVYLANATAGAMVCGCCLCLFYFIHG